MEHGAWAFCASTLMPDTTTLLGHHYSPILMALIPLYWIANDVRILLVVQRILLALGALPVQ
jgi:uncharacterized membrane protein